MKIVAITKTFRGEEFAIPSLKAIYPYMSKIVYVHSDKSWTGRVGNTVAHEIKKFPDIDKKIVSINIDTDIQEIQYQTAYEHIVKNYDYDFIMLIDTDEIWDSKDIEMAISILESNKTANAFTCNMWSYIKSPFFRVIPQDPLKPVVFIRKGSKIEDVRGCGVNPKHHMEDVWMHHFCSVRKNLSEVWGKHKDSCGTENVKKVDKSHWIQKKWNKLPYSSNLLPLADFTHHWKSVKEIDISDLPAVMADSEIVKAFQKYNMTKKYGGDIQKISEKIDFSKYNLPEMFGPSHPDWKIPSKRHKYLMAIGAMKVQDQIVINKHQEKPRKVNTKKDLMLKQRIGSTCIFTAVSGNYQWYIPLFLNRLQKEYPEYDSRVVLRGRMDIPQNIQKGIINIENDDYPKDGYTTAAMRFVEYEDILSKYDYCLITDIDMLIKRENPMLVNQHMAHMEYNELRCYENYVSSIYNGNPRLPGVHFVTKEWWNVTRSAREKFANDLKTNGSHDWAWDEVMLGKIVTESGLKLFDKQQNLWSHHGIHLGDWRRNFEIKKTVHTIPADIKNYIQKIVSDEEFMLLVADCGLHLDMLIETFDFFKKI